VALLASGKASFKPDASGMASGWAVLACLLATSCYGVAASFTKKYLTGLPPLVTATGSQVGASLALAVPAAFTWPTQSPGLTAWGAVLVLCGSYAVLHAGFASLWPGAAHVRSGLVLLVPALGFALLFWIQVRLAAAPQGALARWLYPRAFAGFYLDESLTRLTLWLWRQPGLSQAAQPAVSTPHSLVAVKEPS
jgi:drug/metabolite transporter (DMT)-like permease